MLWQWCVWLLEQLLPVSDSIFAMPHGVEELDRVFIQMNQNACGLLLL